MGIVSDYIRDIMNHDPIIGNELLRLNMSHIMREMNVTPHDLVKAVKKEKKKHK